ncbi:hypothetical protein, partial [uncultured Alcanivorax sp.]|uniref:hypothetical protein n=1 Tax=uncultured Alcanivorax sp. TaxID=191215 RepID=UPI0030D9B819
PLDAGCPTTDACIQNLKTLAAMLSAQNALPDYCLNDGPGNSSKYPLKRDTVIKTVAQAKGLYVRHPASSVYSR